ncbi:MAG: MipA/OmpV family protein [Kiritimatiellia bacterium]
MKIFPLFLLSALISVPLAAQPPPARPWSAGVFTMTDSQPYKDADGIVRVFPFISYRGPRLEVLGPMVRYKLISHEGWTLRVRGAVDFGAYEEDDSAILNGMGDRDTTLLLGLGVIRDLSPNWNSYLTVDRDILGQHDGLEANAGFSRRLGSPRQPLSATLTAGLRLEDKRWTRDRVGVPEDRSREDRPAYSPDHSLHPYIGALAVYRITDRWVTTLILRHEWLDSVYSDSPLVADDTRFTSMFSFSYSF